ncbi:MAG: hypothetical protein ACFFD2_02520 [Promethearchaeota archaeon]
MWLRTRSRCGRAYYDSEEVCGCESLNSADGDPSSSVDRSYGAGGTTNRLPLGRGSSKKSV